MAGGILASLEIRFGRKTFGRIGYLATAAGMVGLLYSFAFTTESDLHPYFITLIPVLSTAAIIWFSSPGDAVSKLLSTRFFVGVGLISYSLYLWHYPIFSFAKAAGLDAWSSPSPSNIYVNVILILIAFLGAVTSYFLVEKPLRYKEWRLFGMQSFGTLLTGSLIVVFGISANSSEGFKTRLRELYDIYGQVEVSNRLLQIDSRKFVNLSKKFESEDSRKVLIVGDSHAKDLFNAFYLNDDLFPGFEFVRARYDFSARNNECFVENEAEFMKFEKTSGFADADFILISSSILNASHVGCIKTFLSSISDLGKNVIVFGAQRFDSPKRVVRKYATPTIKKLRSASILTGLYFDRNLSRKMTAADAYLLSLKQARLAMFEKNQYQLINQKTVDLSRQIRNAAGEFGYRYVDKFDYLCDAESQTCDILTDAGNKIYFDNSHLTSHGAKLMGTRIAKLQLFD